MKTTMTAISAVACIVLGSACAEPAGYDAPAFVFSSSESWTDSASSIAHLTGRNASGTSWQPDSTTRVNDILPDLAQQSLRQGRYLASLSPAISATYRFDLDQRSSIFGYVGQPGEPALGPPVSYMRRFSGFDTVDPSQARHWLDTTHDSARVFTLGYIWRNVKLEGSAFATHQDDERKYMDNDLLEFNSTSGRFSFNPWQNWSLQLSHGRLAGLDQLEPDEDVRRTTISTTYNRPFKEGDWQATLAWGRNTRKSEEPVMGYLLESTLRFHRTYAVFCRLEQVGSDELMRANDSLPRQLFKMNRLTVGYFHHIRTAAGPAFDIGGFASRHLVPSAMTPLYGNDPTSYMMFIRLKFH